MLLDGMIPKLPWSQGLQIWPVDHMVFCLITLPRIEESRLVLGDIMMEGLMDTIEANDEQEHARE